MSDAERSTAQWIPKYPTIADLPDYNAESAALVPPHFLRGLTNYVCDQYAPGSCLRALLENDLATFIGHLHPSMSGGAIKDLYAFVYCCLPWEIWGSPEKVAAWIQKGKTEREAIDAA